MMLVAWHADRVNEQDLHVAVPYFLAGVVLTLFTPLSKISFGAGFAVLVVSVTLANAGLGTLSARVIGCLDRKNAGVGVAIWTAVSACLAGFAGPVVVGTMVQRMGSFSQATVAMGAILAASGLLMAGLALWEWRAGRGGKAAGSSDKSDAETAAVA